MAAMAKRGKIVALSITAAGIVTLVAAGFAVTPYIQEEWYLRELAAYDEESSKRAAEWFSQHGSLRAMRRLFDLLRELALRPDAEDTSKSTCDSIVRISQAIEGIAVRQRREVVPFLVTILKEKPPKPIPGNEVRIGATYYLARIGPDAREAIPALQAELGDEEERFRKYVADALNAIQGNQHAAQK
jgi:HEAT repeat protein